MIDVWSKLLEVLTYRHRLLEAADETDILINIYKETAKKIGLDECHAHLRPVSFEFAQKKPDTDIKPLTLRQLLDDESRIDRYSQVD